MLNKEITVLSLFDGMGGGAIALTELGVKFKYFASEVDKFAIAQTKANFPNVIHLGDVRNVDVSQLPKIDLILAGSPCQSFSFAGKQKGMVTKSEIEILTLDQYLELKADGFEFEGQSYLFWEFVRILTDAKKINPDVKFLLENVEMSKHWEGVLSRAVGLIGVHINSNLVSAQNRPRIYWSNIKTRSEGLFGEMVTDIPQPKDRKIFLKDILQPESEVDEKYYYSEKGLAWINRHSLRKNKQLKIFNGFDKFPCLEATMYKKYSSQRFWAISGKNQRLRYLTPTEAARLQTVSGWYEFKHDKIEVGKSMHPKWLPDQNKCIANTSDTQIYKMCGNGWTIEVIKHILSYLKF